MIIITNIIIISCITQHAPLVKTKSTDPLVPLMKKLNITPLQLKRDNYRYLAYQGPTKEN